MQVESEQATVVGLTSVEAEARRRRGEANTAAAGTSRTNVFSFYNSILFVIGAALLSLARYGDALISVGLGLVNAVISTAQEIRARRNLDSLQLLDQTQVLVVRDGRDVEIGPARGRAATCRGCGPATRSSSTGRCSTATASRPTSRC